MSITRINLKTCDQMAILASARSGPRELARLRQALSGSRPFGAQTRLLLELAAREHLDLAALVDAYKAVRQ